MAEYIEREAVLAEAQEVYHWCGHENRYGDFVPVEAVCGIPASDVAPVVRCVNCIHYGAEASAFDAWTPFCLKHKVTTFPDDFCSYGERKDGE